MNPAVLSLLVPATGLALSLLILFLRSRRPRGRCGILEVAPGYRSFFRELGLTDAEFFLDLPGPTPHVVSGHPDRHVIRLELGGDRPETLFLKREHYVPLRARLVNALAGFGFVSRSLREARMLQALRREGHPGPEWLAAGEDHRGRAFLLVREVPGTELRAALRGESDPGRRRRIARNLGTTLARLHDAGFRHPDLYANHLYVDPRDDSCHLLDWQRGRLTHRVRRPQRRRDLAALHATLAPALATPRERLVLLRAYLRATGEGGAPWRVLADGIEAEARRLLRLRHVREKRQPAAPAQAWICLQGEALCVTPALRRRCGETMPAWIRPAETSGVSNHEPSRRWTVLPDGGRALLVRRRERPPLGRRTRTFVPTAQRHAAILLRLQRHGIPAPEVLALGQQKNTAGCLESFLVTEPAGDTCSLEAWLVRRTRRRAPRPVDVRRRDVLRLAGALLSRLHEASCYLRGGPSGCGLSVRQTGGALEVVVDRAEAVTPRRKRGSRRAARDVLRLEQVLRAGGCSRTDLCRFRAGYRKKDPGDPAHAARKAAAVVRRPEPPPTRGEGLWRRLVRGSIRVCQRADWREFAGEDWTDGVMDLTLTDRPQAKQGRSTGRLILRGTAESGRGERRLAVYLKRHHVLTRWRGLLATLWPVAGWSPAWQEWRNLEWARRQGVPVPRPVAAAEYLGPWGELRSVLAVEELTGMLSLQEAVPLAAVRLDRTAFRRWKLSLAVELARLTRMLHDRLCFHKDLYLCHFFIARSDTAAVPAGGWQGRVHLIDLHRLGHHPRTSWFWQTKDLAQLLYASDILGVDARDRLAFWRAYRGAGPSRHPWTWVRRAVLYRWMRYRHHNARGRQGGQDAWAA